MKSLNDYIATQKPKDVVSSKQEYIDYYNEALEAVEKGVTTSSIAAGWLTEEVGIPLNRQTIRQYLNAKKKY